MSVELGNLIHELEGILHLNKSAAALAGGHGGGSVEKGNIVDGSATATEGSGYPHPRAAQGKDGDGHGVHDHGVNTTQKSDPNRAVDYNKDQPQSTPKDTATHTGGNQDADSQVDNQYNENELKSAAQANQLLAGLSALLTPAQHYQPTPAKQAGSQSAESLIQALLQREMRKSAMDASAIAEKWDSMSPEEKAKCKEEYPEECAKAMAMKKGDGGSEQEKMSSFEQREYMLSKQAGEQAALQILAGLQQPQVDPRLAQQAAIQKQAAANDLMMSHELGRQAAERAWQEQHLAKQAGAQAAQQAATQQAAGYSHPAHQPAPGEAYNEMLKWAHASGINPDALHGMLSDLHRQAALDGGPPHPFALRGHIDKVAVDIGPIRRILTGLLQEGIISQEEAEAIRNRVGGAEALDEPTLMKIVEDVENPREVLERLLAGDVQELQRNTHYANSPVSAMPATQPTTDAVAAEQSRTVSEGGVNERIPGSTEGSPQDVDAASPMIIEAACKRILRNLDPHKYGSL